LPTVKELGKTISMTVNHGAKHSLRLAREQRIVSYISLYIDPA
jgi:hypothetical protein